MGEVQGERAAGGEGGKGGRVCGVHGGSCEEGVGLGLHLAPLTVLLNLLQALNRELGLVQDTEVNRRDVLPERGSLSYLCTQ